MDIEEQWVQRNRGTLGTKEQWVKTNRGYSGTEEQWVHRNRGTRKYRGTVGKEEQRDSGSRGTVGILVKSPPSPQCTNLVARAVRQV